MKIKDMFKDDIDRTINGVVQVEQEKEEVVKQEVQEYVVTTELKKHFAKFFNEYSESFDTPTDNVGVWITGFFGSGKSHFLKMLSYLLENREIDGKKTVDYFEEKFDDELSFMNIQKCVQVPTETILFNIDVEGSVQKDDTAVLRVFAKVFYEHLGFYGKDLKLAKLEQYIASQGKMEAFKEAFKRIRGKEWEDARGTYQFFKKAVIQAIVDCSAMSEEDATLWFTDKAPVDYSVGQLVDEIKAYVDSKPKGFRLLFMIDEAGQYIGTNTSMLLNLQSLIEKLGSVCRGQVWIVATGQEALDDMIKVRADEFSRIMARFAIRLSLTSSSVGEVIEKRLLTKTPEANTVLDGVYENNENVLSNLYAFDTTVGDIKGYTSEDEFARIFPFVPYQFTIMQKVFNEIRKHGHAGKHQSSGERSMLNGFQESAQRIENKNELTLVPMYAFYDTLHSFLDTSVRSVVERAEKAANDGNGLTSNDVDLLKLLYLVRYIDDIKSNIENLTILMADSITIDKIVLRRHVEDSLNRLQKQNYIARNGDIYQFLTDEEQDIAREINNQSIEASAVISQMCKIIFDDIYTTKKYRYTFGDYYNDFDFDKAVDGQNHGISTGELKLRFVTEAYERPFDETLISESSSHEAICKLSNEYSVFSDIETALKIDKFIKQKNVSQLPESIQTIITNRQKESRRLIKEAEEKIGEAIIKGKFFIDGKIESISGTSAKAVLDRALEILVEQTFYDIKCVKKHAGTDADIRNILKGQDVSFEGEDYNKEACDKVYSYLEVQSMSKMPTSMADIQSRFQSIPYGWKEIDVAAVIARLIQEQKVTIKHSGETIQPNDYRIVDFLRKKSETGFTQVSIRETIPAKKIKTVRSILNEYFGIMDIPSDEDGLVSFIGKNFSAEKFRLEEMEKKNESSPHPGAYEIGEALKCVKKVIAAESDNITLIDKICELEDDLLDTVEDMKNVNDFYNSQIKLYDNAIKIKNDVKRYEKDYLFDIPAIQEAIAKIDDITKITNKYKYNRIPELNDCISIIQDERNKVIAAKKTEVNELIDSCLEEVHFKADNEDKLKEELVHAQNQFASKKQEINQINNLIQLDAKKNTITSLKDNIINRMDRILNTNDDTHIDPIQPVRAKKVRQIQRAVVFNQANLTSKEDVNKYVEMIKNKLLSYLNDGEEVQIK